MLSWDLGWTLVSMTIGTNSTRLGVAAAHAGCQIRLVFVFTRQRRADTLLEALIVTVCAVSSRNLDVDSLDGTAKGNNGPRRVVEELVHIER